MRCKLGQPFGLVLYQLCCHLPPWQPDGQLVAKPEQHVVPPVGENTKFEIGEIRMLFQQQCPYQMLGHVDLGRRHVVSSHQPTLASAILAAVADTPSISRVARGNMCGVMTSRSALVLPFAARQQNGTVSVTVWRNGDPTTLGCAESALNFPACTATVEFEAAGYNALLGWVQLVGRQPPDNQVATRTYATDPLQIYDGLETPFGFFGLKPELFDAPSRRDRTMALDWLAESFLCVSPTNPMAREVKPVSGFSWGFVLDKGVVEIVAPRPLEPTAWTKHQKLLSGQYPSWRFLDSDGW